jgi:hypothetical protein
MVVYAKTARIRRTCRSLVTGTRVGSSGRRDRADGGMLSDFPTVTAAIAIAPAGFARFASDLIGPMRNRTGLAISPQGKSMPVAIRPSSPLRHRR